MVENANAATLKAAAERLRGAISDQAFDLSSGEQTVTVSVGAALIQPGVTSTAELTG